MQSMYDTKFGAKLPPTSEKSTAQHLTVKPWSQVAHNTTAIRLREFAFEFTYLLNRLNMSQRVCHDLHDTVS